MAQAGTPHVGLHTLRHTHASMLNKAGEDIITISRRLGHASPTVTLSIYAHLACTKDVAAAAMEAILRGEMKCSRFGRKMLGKPRFFGAFCPY